jgi:hypothetical protein
MSQTMDDFVAKNAAFEAAEATVERVVGELRNFAAPLTNDWKKCFIRLPGTPEPMGLQRRNGLDGTKYPAIVDLHRAIILHFEAEQAAKQAWTNLADAERKAMKMPKWS